LANGPKTKTKGGLGVLNLRLQNDALLLNKLHKCYNNKETPWVQLIWHKYYVSRVPHASSEVGSFWWKDLLRLQLLHRGIARCSIGDGSSVTFWDDLWAPEVLSVKFPRLFSFASDASISVSQVMQAEDLDSLLQLPLSMQAYDELLELEYFISQVPFDPNAKDVWNFIWGNGSYSSSKYYQMVFNNVDAHPIFSKIWKSKCTPRIKFFAWLLIVDRLNTRNMLLRRHFNIQSTAFCVLCDRDIEEDILHLVLSVILLSLASKKLVLPGALMRISVIKCFTLSANLPCSFPWKFFSSPLGRFGIFVIPKFLTMAPPPLDYGSATLKLKVTSNS
jgi:hypothetical protein